MEFKIGDKVKLIDPFCNHYEKIGTVIEKEGPYPEDGSSNYNIQLDSQHLIYVSDEQIELVESAPNRVELKKDKKDGRYIQLIEIAQSLADENRHQLAYELLKFATVFNQN